MKVISEKNVLTIVSGNVTLEIGSNEFDSIDFIKNIQRIIAWEEGERFYNWDDANKKIAESLGIETHEEEIKSLQHFKDSSVGLWCTDKPEVIPEDKKHLFFQLK